MFRSDAVNKIEFDEVDRNSNDFFCETRKIGTTSNSKSAFYGLRPVQGLLYLNRYSSYHFCYGSKQSLVTGRLFTNTTLTTWGKHFTCQEM